MRVLALDCSTSIGWALFDSPAKVVRLDTWRVPRSFLLGDYGKAFVELERWLNFTVERFAPTVIAFEAPLVPFAGFVERQSSVDIIRLLIGMAAIVELVAKRAGIRCIEVPVPTAKKRLTGNGRAKKREMITAAVKLGLFPASDHEADAIACGLAAFDHLERV